MNRELLLFEVAGVKLALPLDKVEEVVPIGQVTFIPNSPPFLLGLAAIRGKVMAVIDAARRYGLGPALSSYFMICNVRGNLTAIAIDRPLVAGDVTVRDLGEEEFSRGREASGLDGKFVRGGYELMEREKEEEPKPTGLRFLTVDPDLFVSAEMASKIGEG
jgi:chemotaxis signal transduction protein